MKCLKRFRRGLFAAMAMVLTAGQMAMGAFAADDEYTFTVTLDGGNLGTLENPDVSFISDSATMSRQGNKIVISNLHYNDQVTLDTLTEGSVSLTGDNEKYYVMGVRKSGRDNRQDDVNNSEYKGADTMSFFVTSDADYVVAYGYKGNMVAYTVSYVNTEGQELRPSRTYYGSVGDKPVVAYLYIEGYQPQAYNLTKTLSADASQNALQFVYQATQTPEQPTPAPSTPDNNQGGTGTGGTGTGTGTGTGAGTGTGTGTGAGTTTDNGENTDNNTTTDNGTAGTDNTVESPDDNTPRDVLDLDDDNVPLANTQLPDSTVGGNRTALPIVIGACAGGAAVIALIILGVVLLKKRAKK